MKLELKENMYYRTYSGSINKITSIKDYNEREYLLNGFYINKDTIKKASYNITDILEIGDYINGFPVIHKENDILKCGLLVQFKENDIKSIVTKEQFEQMAYKVGE